MSTTKKKDGWNYHIEAYHYCSQFPLVTSPYPNLVFHFLVAVQYRNQGRVDLDHKIYMVKAEYGSTEGL